MCNEAYYKKLLDAVNDKKRFSGINGIVITKIEHGRAEGSMPCGEATGNPMGAVHGGALATLADTLAGVAVAGMGVSAVTLNNTMNYLRRAETGTLHGTAVVAKSGRTVFVCETIIRDDEGRDIASGTFTYYSSAPPFGR